LRRLRRSTPHTRTTREIITDIYAALDQPARITALMEPMLRAIGLVNRDVYELLSTYYQFTAPLSLTTPRSPRRSADTSPAGPRSSKPPSAPTATQHRHKPTSPRRAT